LALEWFREPADFHLNPFPWLKTGARVHLALLGLLLSLNSSAPAQSLSGKDADRVPKKKLPVYTLTVDSHWLLNAPKGERFDASGLAWRNNELWTVNDRTPVPYRVEFIAGTNEANLVPVPNFFTTSQLAPFAKEKVDRYDTEGIAVDEENRVYISEEANRWILRCTPSAAGNKVERLEIDWSPVKKYFDPTDANASFEGVTVGGGKIFVANERQRGRILVVDRKTLKVVDDFTAQAIGGNVYDVHYSDLAWHDGFLFALLREGYVVLKINPTTHETVAQFSFSELEHSPEYGYLHVLPVGIMEGLAVDKDWIWLATDNNGMGRIRAPQDHRPTLFRCKRPDQTGGQNEQ
jgi:hypothetical protein